MAKQRITPVQTSQPYKFSVYRNAAFTFSVSTATKIPFDTKIFDTSSNLDITTNIGRFTAPVAGFYQFNALISIVPNGSGILWASIWKNGSEYRRGTRVSISTDELGSNVVSLMQLAVNDYVEIYVISTGGSPSVEQGAKTTYFDGYLVSGT